MINEEYITVTRLNKYVQRQMTRDPNLKTVYLKGEISNYKVYPSGHHYFTIKDDKSSISAVMFYVSARKLQFKPEDGMKVLVKGEVSIYPATGKYQIIVRKMIEDGVGNLYVAYNQLKNRLEKEGYFKEEHKKPIPKFPNKIGVVTAQTGAAIHDIITTIERRWPLCEVLLFPTLVQGQGSAQNIARQIQYSQNFNLDTLIVGRGGGSIEDLWSFNEEIVAKAIFESEIPVISAVGHEVDFTIADFIADMRAPTPTAAAEMAVPDCSEISNQMDSLNIRLREVMNKKLDSYSQRLHDIKNRNMFKNPQEIYSQKEMDLDMSKERLNYSANRIIMEKESRFNRLKDSYYLRNPYDFAENKERIYTDLSQKLKENMDDVIKSKERSLIRAKEFYSIRNPKALTKNKEQRFLEVFNKLELLNPMLTIKRGYTLTKKDGKVVSKSKDLEKGDLIEIEFSDGNVESKVI